MELRPQVMIWELVLLQSECGVGGGPESSGVCVLGKAACLSLSAEEWGAPTARKGLGLGWGCSGWQLTRIRGPQDPGGGEVLCEISTRTSSHTASTSTDSGARGPRRAGRCLSLGSLPHPTLPENPSGLHLFLWSEEEWVGGYRGPGNGGALGVCSSHPLGSQAS